MAVSLRTPHWTVSVNFKTIHRMNGRLLMNYNSLSAMTTSNNNAGMRGAFGEHENE
jgi:hypothetical protein